MIGFWKSGSPRSCTSVHPYYYYSIAIQSFVRAAGEVVVLADCCDMIDKCILIGIAQDEVFLSLLE